MRLPPWRALFCAAFVSNVVLLHRMLFKFGHQNHSKEEVVQYQVPHEGGCGKKKNQTDPSSYCALSTEAPRRYLVADLRGGLNNQAIEVWVALLVSQHLNRTLVLPQVRAKIKYGHNYAAEGTSELESFDYIWDVSHFLQCARKKLNNSELHIVTDSTHYEAHIKYRS